MKIGSLLGIMNEGEKIHWFAMRAYKCEQRAAAELDKTTDLEYFIAKHPAVRIYHGKKYTKLLPVIPSLVFVRGCRLQIAEFKKRFNTLQFVTRITGEGLEYLIVPDKQMEDFIRVTRQHEHRVTYFKPGEVDLKKGTRVRILGGVFDGVEGVFLKICGIRSRRLVVSIPHTLIAAVEVEPDLIEVIEG